MQQMKNLDTQTQWVRQTVGEAKRKSKEMEEIVKQCQEKNTRG